MPRTIAGRDVAPSSCRHRAAPAGPRRTSSGSRRPDCRTPGWCRTAPRRVAVRPAPQHGLHHHAAHRVADEHRPLQPRFARSRLSTSSASASKPIALTGGALAVAGQIERDRLISGSGEAARSAAPQRAPPPMPCRKTTGIMSAPRVVRMCTGDCGSRRRCPLRCGAGHEIFRLLPVSRGAARPFGLDPGLARCGARTHYDVVIVGGGGHGLATAYYLAKEHGITNVAVLEKGWIGSGNAGRNTTIIRSNYLLPGNKPFYELSMKLWEGLEQDLNYNAMVSQRGVLNLYHSDAQRDAYARRGNAMRLHGVDAELLDRDGVRAHGAVPRFRQCALSDPGRPAAAARRHGAPRRGRLGLCARRRRARRRHRAELRSHRASASRTAASPGVETTRGSIGARQGRARGRRQLLARRRAWRACGCRSKAMCCRPSCPRASSRSSTASSPSAPGISTSASPTRAAWCSAATSTATIPMRSAATCRWSRMSWRAAWR